MINRVGRWYDRRTGAWRLAITVAGFWALGIANAWVFLRVLRLPVPVWVALNVGAITAATWIRWERRTRR